MHANIYTETFSTLFEECKKMNQERKKEKKAQIIDGINAK
jgi:hypothetical protein